MSQRSGGRGGGVGEALDVQWVGVGGPVEFSSISTRSMAIVGTSAIITLYSHIRNTQMQTVGRIAAVGEEGWTEERAGGRRRGR